MFQVMSTGQVDVVLDHILQSRTIEHLIVQEVKVVMVQGTADRHPLLAIHQGTCQMVIIHQQVTGIAPECLNSIITHVTPRVKP